MRGRCAGALRNYEDALACEPERAEEADDPVSTPRGEDRARHAAADGAYQTTLSKSVAGTASDE